MFFIIAYPLSTVQRWQNPAEIAGTCRFMRYSLRSNKAQATGVWYFFNYEKMKNKKAFYLICKKALPFSAFRK